MGELEKRLIKCASQEKTVAMMSRLEDISNGLNRRMNTDFTTKDAVNDQLKIVNSKLSTEFVSKKEHRDQSGRLSDRMKEVDEANTACKKAL